ncbi:MAG: DUF4331 domain-containing protein [Solirubrobacteraceae bacterium]
MSSHREAPEISKDPVADNADVYAFVSPDRPDTVTMLSNFVPLQGPDGGPNFYEFGNDVLYSINIDNDGDGKPEISYFFRFHTKLRNEETFLYNTGPITSLNSPNWNKRQFFTVVRVTGEDTTAYGTHRAEAKRLKTHVLGRNLPCPPCNIGPRSTPNYEKLGKAAVHRLHGGVKVFAGQRQDGFYVDLGAVFDLGDLRPFENLHLISTPAAKGVDATAMLNIHTIAIQVPIRELVKGGHRPTDPMSKHATIGVWSAASRRKVRMIDPHNDKVSSSGPWVQVSRLGNPLFNEVIVPLGDKDRWNAIHPANDKQFAHYVAHPELAGLLPVLYPHVFPHLAHLNSQKKPRADLEAILLTGIPKGIVPGFQNYTGPVPADQLRLNVAIPPTTHKPSIYGLLGGDDAGFPNGRRVFDDIVSIELRAVAGVTYALVDSSYKPDAAAGELTQGLTPQSDRYLKSFPYLGQPLSGFDVPNKPTG